MATTTSQRTWRIQIFSDRDTLPRFEMLRERVKTYDDGEVVAVPDGTVARTLTAELAATTLPGGKVTLVTFADLAALLSACGHALAREDVDRAKTEAKRLADDEIARAARVARELP